jgi:hypothetical protein
MTVSMGGEMVRLDISFVPSARQFHAGPGGGQQLFVSFD